MRGPSYFRLTRSVSWLLMPWLLMSPEHQQPWYWLCRIGRFFSCLVWGRISTTCVISMWRNDTKCKYMFMFPLKNLSRKGLIMGISYLLLERWSLYWNWLLIVLWWQVHIMVMIHRCIKPDIWDAMRAEKISFSYTNMNGSTKNWCSVMMPILLDCYIEYQTQHSLQEEKDKKILIPEHFLKNEYTSWSNFNLQNIHLVVKFSTCKR